MAEIIGDFRYLCEKAQKLIKIQDVFILIINNNVAPTAQKT